MRVVLGSNKLAKKGPWRSVYSRRFQSDRVLEKVGVEPAHCINLSLLGVKNLKGCDFSVEEADHVCIVQLGAIKWLGQLPSGFPHPIRPGEEGSVELEGIAYQGVHLGLRRMTQGADITLAGDHQLVIDLVVMRLRHVGGFASHFLADFFRLFVHSWLLLALALMGRYCSMWSDVWGGAHSQYRDRMPDSLGGKLRGSYPAGVGDEHAHREHAQLVINNDLLSCPGHPAADKAVISATFSFMRGS